MKIMLPDNYQTNLKETPEKKSNNYQIERIRR
jgi:hypothetical protein